MPNFLQVASCAERLIGDLVPINCDLFSIESELSVELPTVEHRLSTTATNGLEFFKAVGNLK